MYIATYVPGHCILRLHTCFHIHCAAAKTARYASSKLLLRCTKGYRILSTLPCISMKLGPWGSSFISSGRMACRILAIFFQSNCSQGLLKLYLSIGRGRQCTWKVAHGQQSSGSLGNPLACLLVQGQKRQRRREGNPPSHMLLQPKPNARSPEYFREIAYCRLVLHHFSKGTSQILNIIA